MQDNRIKPELTHENFPVASKLLPERCRQPILSFYSLIRGMDNIADDGSMPNVEKRDHLRRIRLAFQENQPEMLPSWAQDYYHLLAQRIFSHEWADKLWQAFWTDTEKSRYRDMDEVLAYCHLSAVPVGRFILEIAGEVKAKRSQADALCIALQLINHLQDVRSDYLERKRIYLPQFALDQQGLSERILEKAETGPKLRIIFNQWLDIIDDYLALASHLPKTIYHRGLRWEVQIIIAYAKALSRQLRKKDPMYQKVKLSASRKIWISILAILGWMK